MKVIKLLHGKESVYENITKVEMHGGIIALYSGDMLVYCTVLSGVRFDIEE